ncbi:MAG: 8-amino-7-oxononanoate synthase [Muribaculaceae bacterium]|nr:8-amino-7-oxononanoate synthase [Muribaculaceae bacterium]
MENKFEGYRKILEKYKEEGRYRSIPPDRDIPQRIDLSGNDYLGLGQLSREFQKEFMEKCDASFTSSASRLLAGRQNNYKVLEEFLETLYGSPALLFNSGYHANVGCISALAVPGTLFLCDKLIHASVIDGIAMGNAEWARWKHNDVGHLNRLLKKHEGSAERVIVVAESIYSMDGDLAPLKELVELKKHHPKMILYLDEAHAFGVRGKQGLGIAEEAGVIKDVDILVGTFVKACASAGAFVITSPLLKAFLVNSARSFIFSTALPPLNAAWTLEMIKRITKMNKEREYLREISKDFRNFISRITGKTLTSESQIVPLMVGDAEKAVEIARCLNEEGIDALAIRRPTVPPGGERIRFSLHASLSPEQISMVKEAIEKVLLKQ